MSNLKFNIELISKNIRKEGFSLPFSLTKPCGVWREDGVIVGLIQGKDIADLMSKEIFIEFFEVKVKGKHYGKKCILDLFYQYVNLERIDGATKEGAQLFWKYMNGFFASCCDECEDLKNCIKHGYACDNRESDSFFILKEDVVGCF